MQRSRLALALLAFVAISSAPARADQVTSVETPLFAGPGEASRKLAVLAPGTEVEIIGRKGRWLKTRAAGKRGWVPRSAVDEAQTPEPPSPSPEPGRWRARPAVRAGAERKAIWMDGSELVRVGQHSIAARAEPRAAAAAVFDAAPGDELRVAGRRTPGWLLVENARGVSGWVARSSLRVAPAAPAAAPPAAVERDAARSAQRQEPDRATALLAGRRWIRAGAGIGIASLASDFSSDGTGELGAYRISASAAAASSSLELAVAPTRRLWMAADGGYQLALGIPGIRQRGAEEAAVAAPLGFAWHRFDGGGRLGLRVGTSALAYARVGYHFEWFHVDEVSNPGRLARESLSGPTAGLGLTAALGTSVLLRARADLLVGGRRRQTPGLEDGEDSSALAAWGEIGVSYLAARSLAFAAAYSLGWAHTEWRGSSPRQPDVTGAVRTDRSHLLLVGVEKQL